MKKYFISIFVSFLAIIPENFAKALTNPDPGLFVNSLGDNSFKGILLFIIQSILLPIVGVISVLFVIVGGFQYIMARGNEEQAEAGKKTVTNAIIGIVVVTLSYIIIAVVVNALFGNVQ